MKSWDDLDFWKSGEWQVCEEKLDDMDRAKRLYNPSRKNLFAALRSTPYDTVKVAIIGQDPYPDHNLCTGLAFSVPVGVTKLPPSLDMIFDEYESDLNLPRPNTGDLTLWTKEGVLLWNSNPTCEANKSLSHRWDEWTYLTSEIIQKLVDKGGVVFAFVGGIAGSVHNMKLATHHDSRVLKFTHPSPRATRFARTPFPGCRMFSKINDHLSDLGQDKVEWRLP